MTKQEEIREGIANFLELQCHLDVVTSKYASGFICKYLHDNGVVIKVEQDVVSITTELTV